MSKGAGSEWILPSVAVIVTEPNARLEAKPLGLRKTIDGSLDVQPTKLVMSFAVESA
jgi:hypothetical protein